LHLVLGARAARAIQGVIKIICTDGSGDCRTGVVGGIIGVAAVGSATPRSGSGAVGGARNSGAGIGAGVVGVAGVCGAVGSGRTRTIGRAAGRSGDRINDHISDITLTACAGARNSVGGRFGACGGVGQRAGGDRAGRGRDSRRRRAGPAAVLRAGDRGGSGVADSVVECYRARAGDRGRAGRDAARGRGGCRGIATAAALYLAAGAGTAWVTADIEAVGTGGGDTTAAALYLAAGAGTAGVTGSIKAVGTRRDDTTAVGLYLAGRTAATEGV